MASPHPFAKLMSGRTHELVPTRPHLVLDRVEKKFGLLGAQAVQSLSIEVGQGELLGLLGPSGCGKTTTLRMIAGLMSTSGGRIMVAGTDVTALPPHRRNMGIVFQNYALFPHMSVADNVGFGLDMRGVAAAERAQRIQRALELVHLNGYGARRPRELSGGQQQRVGLARALVIEPSILLLDEPLSNLDANLREEMRTEIRDIQRRLGITTVFVTHDQTEALAVCDRIAVMREGLLEQLGTPHDIYERPANAFVAGFVGRINRIPGTQQADGSLLAGDAIIRGSTTARPGPVVVMVRPHRIRIADQPSETAHFNSVQGRVLRTTFVGDVLSVEVRAASAMMTVEAHTFAGAMSPSPGQNVFLVWKVEDTLVFPDESGA